MKTPTNPHNPFPPLTRGETRFLLVRIDRGPDKRGAGSRTTARGDPVDDHAGCAGHVPPEAGREKPDPPFPRAAGRPVRPR